MYHVLYTCMFYTIHKIILRCSASKSSLSCDVQVISSELLKVLTLLKLSFIQNVLSVRGNQIMNSDEIVNDLSSCEVIKSVFISIFGISP